MKNDAATVGAAAADAKGPISGALAQLRGAFGKARGPLAQLLLAAVAAGVIALFATAEHESLAMTEGRFLAAEAFLVLASIAWLGRSFLPQLIAGATVFAAIALPALPTRSAAMTAILAIGWILAVAPLALPRSDGRGPSPADYFFAVLGLQALARPDLLLQPWEPRSVAIVLMPALAALALTYLAAEFGSERALFGLAAAALLAPGLNVNATLLLLAAAAGVYAGDAGRWLPARGAAAVFLVLPLILRWPLGLAASAAGATLLLEKLAPRWRWAPSLVAALAAIAIAAGKPQFPPLDALLLGAALLPAALAAAGAERWRVGSGILLMLAAAWLGREPEGWAAGGLLLALSLPLGRPIQLAQRAYFLLLLAGGLQLAAFPWLRPEPVLEIASLLAPSPLFFFLGALLLVVLPGLLLPQLAPRGEGRWLPALAAGGLVVWLVGLMPAAGVSLLGGKPQSLAEAQPMLRFEIAGGPCRQAIVDSQLFHGAELAVGQEVARLRFLGSDGAELLVLPLRAWEDTADWAAARTDVERLADQRAPRPWLSQVAPDGTFFSGRFRHRYQLPRPIDAAALELVRAEGLPAATQIAFHELELRR